MITDFGKYIRKMRIDQGERLKDMADTLGCSSAFLSAIETGRKQIPALFEEKIIVSYNLTDLKADQLRIASDRSRASFVFTPENQLQNDVAGAMARKMSTLSSQDLTRIYDILNQKK